MFVALLAFYSRISDPRFGGTYMTLLNTLSNLGNAWSTFAVLRVVDLLTFRECSFDSKNDCSTLDLQNVSYSQFFHELIIAILFFGFTVSEYNK
jgi:MFS transporter, PAT family, solute carrier family 33 (acetyl-CoA transportor), member 1